MRRAVVYWFCNILMGVLDDSISFEFQMKVKASFWTKRNEFVYFWVSLLKYLFFIYSSFSVLIQCIIQFKSCQYLVQWLVPSKALSSSLVQKIVKAIFHKALILIFWSIDMFIQGLKSKRCFRFSIILKLNLDFTCFNISYFI